LAGFSQIGGPNVSYGINPPTLSNPISSPAGYLPLQLSGRPTKQAGFYDTADSYASGADTSPWHQANVYMKRMGMGDQLGSNIAPNLPQYGLSYNDWQDVNRFASNPLSQQNVDAYQGITNRFGNMLNQNPQFGMWNPQERTQFATDAPLRLGAGYNVIPPPILQNWNIPITGNYSGLRY
jgi:hypothetical protein